MAESIISQILLPSQQGMSSNDIVSDCLEKLRVLALSMPEGDFFTAYANKQMLHQYATLLDDLAEIALYHHELREEKNQIN